MLIRTLDSARNQLIGIEHRTDTEIDAIRAALEKECEGEDAAAVAAVARLKERL